MDIIQEPQVGAQEIVEQLRKRAAQGRRIYYEGELVMGAKSEGEKVVICTFDFSPTLRRVELTVEEARLL